MVRDINNNIKNMMRETKLDVLFPSNPITAAYLIKCMDRCNITLMPQELPNFPLFFQNKEPILVGYSWFSQIKKYQGKRYELWTLSRALFAVAKVIKNNGLDKGKIGIDMDFVPLNAFNRLKEYLPYAQFIDASFIFHQLRVVKSSLEIKFIKHSLASLEKSFNKMMEEIKHGERSIMHLEKIFHREVIKAGLDNFAAHPLNRFAEKWEGVRIPSSLPQNKITYFDIIGEYQGYYADFITNICDRGISAEEKTLYKLHCRVQEIIVENVKCGMSAPGAYQVCQTALERKLGYKGWWMVHGIGLEVHEEPLVGSSILLFSAFILPRPARPSPISILITSCSGEIRAPLSKIPAPP